MGIARSSKKKWQKLSLDDQDRVINMCWEDRTSFDSIEKQFGLTANEVVKFMRTQLDPKTFTRWRIRATQRGHLKQAKLRPKTVIRFKCSRQRLDGTTKGWK